MNIGNEYHGKDRSVGFWRDAHLRMRGPAVLQLQQIFAEDWYYATGEELIQPELFPPPQTTGTTTAQVVVTRTAPGAFMARLAVTDDCGAWSTFLGGGAGVP